MVGVAFQLVHQFKGFHVMDLEVAVGGRGGDTVAVGGESQSGYSVEVSLLDHSFPGSIRYAPEAEAATTRRDSRAGGEKMPPGVEGQGENAVREGVLLALVADLAGETPLSGFLPGQQFLVRQGGEELTVRSIGQRGGGGPVDDIERQAGSGIPQAESDLLGADCQ